MNAEIEYNKLWKKAQPLIAKGAIKTDACIDDVADRRAGISLIIRPDLPVKSAIQEFIDASRHIEPGQYYYPINDLHITVLSTVSCYDGFTLQSFNPADYIATVRASLQQVAPFAATFAGITASPDCVMVQGFADLQLNMLRKNLRAQFRKTTLETSLDKRYTLKLAHSTVTRFKTALADSNGFLKLLQQYREHQFGTTLVKEVELVFNDWYMRTEKVQVLSRFTLHG